MFAFNLDFITPPPLAYKRVNNRMVVMNIQMRRGWVFLVSTSAAMEVEAIV